MTSAITFDEPRPKRRCLRGWFLLAASFLLLAHVSPAQAAFVLDMTVQNATVSAGGVGSFDVVLRNDASANQSVSIGGFSIDLTIPSGTGISLTGANDLTSATYIFAGNSLGFLPTVTATEVQANDFAATGGTLLAPGGATVGLAHITFTAAAGTPSQVVPVSLISAQAGTSLSDDAGNPLPFTIINGQITVGTVPEPSSVIMLGTAIVLGLAYHRPRRA